MFVCHCCMSCFPVFTSSSNTTSRSITYKDVVIGKIYFLLVRIKIKTHGSRHHQA